jgi:sugar O-acyltransferase (sialic acid O-acetyltransferase NeuD family)
MNNQCVIIIGSSGHSKVIIDILEKGKEHHIVGLIDSFRKIGEETLGYKILGKEEDLPQIISQYPKCKFFVAIGDNWVRKKMVDKIRTLVPDAEFTNAIHPSAQIGKNVKIGIGVALMAGTVINSDSKIEDFTIINTNSSLGHDSKMAQFSSLAPRVSTGGNVRIGEFSAISIGATIKHGISIGKHTVIGAASLLLKCCGDNLVMYGIPAKEIRKRENGEKYL